MTTPHPDYAVFVARQREYFLSGATRPSSWRKAQLEPRCAPKITKHRPRMQNTRSTEELKSS
jgi:hypothetical protein